MVVIPVPSKTPLTDALDLLEVLATPGPWTFTGPRVEGAEVESGHPSMVIYDEGGHSEHDAALIVALRNAYPQLRKLERDRAELIEALTKHGRIGHYHCEDSWYSCPKAEGGCANDAEGDECNCGADDRLAAVDALLAKVQSPA